MKKISISEIEKELATLAGTSEPVEIIDSEGKSIAVLLDLDQFRAVQEVMDLASDPKQLAEILDAHDRFQSGNLEGFEEMALAEV